MPTYKTTGNQMFKIKRKNRTRREGISIIEVLTSMAVATIGVFGVMVMIPFAVKQSQTGLDNDAANAVGRNAHEELQTGGFLAVDPFDNFARMLVRVPITPGDNAIIATNLPDPPNRMFEACSVNFPGEAVLDGFGALRYNRPGPIHFDPIGVTGDLTELNIPLPAAPGIRIYSATASRTGFADLNANGVFDPGTDLPAGGPVTAIEADRICRSSDELFHADDSDDSNSELNVAPPQPLFNFDAGNEVKRQSSGRISWSAFLVPEKDPGLTGSGVPVTRYRSYSIAYRDRFVEPNDPIGSNYEVYLTNMSVAPGANGFQRSVSQINFAAGNGVDTEEVVRGSWIMLVNRIPDPDTALGGAPLSILQSGRRYRAADVGYRTQLMFARVTRVSDDGLSITVDGGAFDFVPAGIDAGNGNPVSSETYMVHLKNVVNVYERTVSVDK